MKISRNHLDGPRDLVIWCYLVGGFKGFFWIFNPWNWGLIPIRAPPPWWGWLCQMWMQPASMQQLGQRHIFSTCSRLWMLSGLYWIINVYHHFPFCSIMFHHFTSLSIIFHHFSIIFPSFSIIFPSFYIIIHHFPHVQMFFVWKLGISDRPCGTSLDLTHWKKAARLKKQHGTPTMSRYSEDIVGI